MIEKKGIHMVKLLNLLSVYCLLMNTAISPVTSYSEKNTVNSKAQIQVEDTYIETPDGKASVEYLPELDGFYLTNVDMGKVEEVFGQPVFSSDDDEIARHDMLAEQAFAFKSHKDAGQPMRFTRTYTLYSSYTGFYGEAVSLVYTATMNMTTKTVNGTTYDAFVSFVVNPTMYVNHTAYITAEGTSSVSGSITVSGSLLTLSQNVQLMRQISTGVTLTYAWVGVTIGGVYYAKGPVRFVSVQKALPLYYVLQQ